MQLIADADLDHGGIEIFDPEEGIVQGFKLPGGIEVVLKFDPSSSDEESFEDSPTDLQDFIRHANSVHVYLHDPHEEDETAQTGDIRIEVDSNAAKVDAHFSTGVKLTLDELRALKTTLENLADQI